MRRTLVVASAFILCALLYGCGGARDEKKPVILPEIPGWEKLSFGMTPDQVKSAYPNAKVHKRSLKDDEDTKEIIMIERPVEGVIRVQCSISKEGFCYKIQVYFETTDTAALKKRLFEKYGQDEPPSAEMQAIIKKSGLEELNREDPDEYHRRFARERSLYLSKSSPLWQDDEGTEPTVRTAVCLSLEDHALERGDVQRKANPAKPPL